MATLADSSPPTPRPSTPLSRLEERDPALAADPKYRRYVQQVDKCLATFETINEWADFISFLTRLLKTFQSFMQFKEIPRKLTVAKRLAQCLNPALPSGVHQRALDVYAHILAVIGSDGLQHELQIWSSGLFPFFQSAATSVKPALLNIYDTHYLPLQSNLRPVMKAFILALLPGLEDETSEFFDKVLHSLDRLSGTVSPAFFFQNIWLVLLTVPVVRSPALNYLLRRLPKMKSDDDITPIVGSDVGLMVRAFAVSLEDENLLVRRGIMDILSQSLPVNSVGLQRCQTGDRMLLMRATISVVMRRDLSLNRRLYNWLLGPSENSDAQIAYFRENALGLLEETLKSDMNSSNSSERESRPYKIAISLLDKSEIGIPLTETLCLDALFGLKQAIESSGLEDSDALLTANTLYEAMEPSIVWTKLFHALMDEIFATGTQFKAIEMLQFILSTFHVRDEEIEQVHLPLFFAVLCQVVRVLVADNDFVARSATVSQILTLVRSVLVEMPRATLFIWPAAGDQPGSTAFTRAQAVYGYEGLNNHSASWPASSPLLSVFQDLLATGPFLAESIKSSQSSDLHEASSTVLSLLHDVVDVLGVDILSLEWDPSRWFKELFESCVQSGQFRLVDSLLSLSIDLATSNVEPHLTLNSRPCVSFIVTKLLRYLEPQSAPFHARTCELIWSVDSITSRQHVEAVIAHGLTNGTVRSKSASFEAFGILWRSTDDAQMPGFRLMVPMLLVLDSLRSDDPHFRRIGETWMRCSLKSYARVLEPLLHDLIRPAYSTAYQSTVIQGRTVHYQQYERPIDQSRVHYLLESLLSLVRFGGQGFSKSIKTTALPESLIAQISGMKRRLANYLDLLVTVLLRFLQTEPSTALSGNMEPMNVKIQSTVIDILQLLVARGEMDRSTLVSAEETLLSKLYISVHTARLDLQNKLLHILHSVISALSPKSRPSPQLFKIQDGQAKISEHSTNLDPSPDKIHPLLVQTLVDGVSKSSNRPVLQHWTDFILMTVPQFSESLHHLVLPLCDCVCQQLRIALADIYHVVAHPKGKGTLSSATSDAEFVILLNALERLVLITLSRVTDIRSSEDDFADRSSDGGGLLGYVSGVFSSDSPTVASEEHLSPRSPGYRCLHDAVRVLYTIWTMSSWQSSDNGSSTDSLSQIYSRTRLRSRKVLERFFKAQPVEVLESVVEYWQKDAEPSLGRQKTSACTFEMVDYLNSSAQTVVHMVCESALSRTPFQSDRPERGAINPYLTDTMLFEFLDEYFNRLEGPIAVQVWPRSMTLAKDVSANMHSYRQQVFSVLKCLTTLAVRLAQTTALDDKRTRRDFQDVYVKLVDNCVLIAGRSFDQGTWMRRSQRDTLNVEGLSKAQSDASINEKVDNPPADTGRSTATSDVITQIEEFLAQRVLPNLRRFLNDPDKVAGVCSNIGYYITTPAIKARAGSLEIPDSTFALLVELAKLPPAFKAWRLTVGELFNDSRFFSNKCEAGVRWTILIRTLMESDKDRLLDVISKVGLAPSANIFTSKEMESLLRCMTIRRMSYILFSGEKDQFLTQLPGIQEKVVDLLRTASVPGAVLAEVYLCLRVVLCRFSSHSISTFWPIILTELVRLFETVMLEPPTDNSEDLVPLLAACRFLDLLLVLQIEEFQIHQWMFVTDTVDAVYKPDDWHPQSLMDQLADTVANLPASKARAAANGKDRQTIVSNGEANAGVFNPASTSSRRPMLDKISRITSIRDLLPFFSHVSIFSYESVYAGGVVDWESVESGIVSEMFDGH